MENTRDSTNTFCELKKRIEYLDNQNKLQTNSVCAMIDAPQAIASWICASNYEVAMNEDHFSNPSQHGN